MHEHPSPPEKPLPPSAPPTPEPSAPEEQTSYLDEAVIGRIYRWSALGFVLIVLLVAGGVWLARRKPPPPPPKLTRITAPVSPQPPALVVPAVRFTDITTSSGIRFVHNNGAYGEKLLPETMGGGVAFLDYDGDGDQDLLLVNSTYWPDHEPPGKRPTSPALYRNNGTGRFEDATVGSGLEVSPYGMGVAVGDYDNDGRVDVFISAVGPDHLFHNESHGTFKDVSAQAGVRGDPTAWGSSCAWFDFDNDGDLDLFVANYVQWSRQIDFEVDYRLDGIGRAYGPPMNFPGTFPFLYRNDGQGKFTDVTAASGMQITNTHTGVPMAKSLGVAPADLDADGWMDLIVANDTVPNFVFHNQRNGTFAEIGAASGLAFDNYGQTRGAMGIDTGYFHNDTRLGVVIGNFANEMTALYVAQQNPLLFTDDAIPEGVGPASRLLLKFGVFFFDCDLDGRLDLLSANGHLEQDIAKVQQSQTYAQPAQLFWNCGQDRGPTYVAVSADHAGPDLFQPIVGRGSAYADIDADGDLDVILTQIGGPPLLLRNEQRLNRHWLRLALVGTKCNADAIGALIRVSAGGKEVRRQVMATRSYLSQSELPVTIGLGELDHVDQVDITWPGGTIQHVGPVPVDRPTVVKQTD